MDKSRLSNRFKFFQFKCICIFTKFKINVHWTNPPIQHLRAAFTKRSSTCSVVFFFLFYSTLHPLLPYASWNLLFSLQSEVLFSLFVSKQNPFVFRPRNMFALSTSLFLLCFPVYQKQLLYFNQSKSPLYPLTNQKFSFLLLRCVLVYQKNQL